MANVMGFFLLIRQFPRGLPLLVNKIELFLLTLWKVAPTSLHRHMSSFAAC